MRMAKGRDQSNIGTSAKLGRLVCLDGASLQSLVGGRPSPTSSQALLMQRSRGIAGGGVLISLASRRSRRSRGENTNR